MEEMSSPSSSNSSNPCPICLGPITQEAYLDRCFHKFCYNCIVRWTNVVASKGSCSPSFLRCPLCKTENYSIIHGYDGTSFQQHYVSQESNKSFFFTKSHKYRLQCYYTEPGALNDKFNVSQYWKSCKYLRPNRWLQSWLRREIQSLIQEEDVEIIVHHIVGVIESFLKRNEHKSQRTTPEMGRNEFDVLVSDAARPFLSGRAERFVNELELFLASGLNIEAFDDAYMQHLGLRSPRVTSEGAEGEKGHQPRIPNLHIFAEDYDETD